MPQHYLNPSDESSHRLPNIETMRVAYGYCEACGSLRYDIAIPASGTRLPCEDRECRSEEQTVELAKMGWFWWFCLPGCLPDSEPQGPFETEALALADARQD